MDTNASNCHKANVLCSNKEAKILITAEKPHESESSKKRNVKIDDSVSAVKKLCANNVNTMTTENKEIQPPDEGKKLLVSSHNEIPSVAQVRTVIEPAQLESVDVELITEKSLQDDITIAKILRSSVTSLQTSALNVLLKNVNLLEASKFDTFSEKVQDILFHAFQSLGWLTSPHIVPMMMTESTKHIIVNLTSGPKYSPTTGCCWWTVQSVSALFETMIECCKENVRTLNLSLAHREFKRPVHSEWISTPSITQLRTLILNMPSLAHLVLNKCKVNDKMLEIIATACQHLISLDVSENKMITNYGVIRAFNIETNRNFCEKLLTLNIISTQINEKGFCIILDNLISLHSLNCQKFNRILCNYLTGHVTNQLSINTLRITLADNLSVNDILTIFTICRNMEILTIDKVIVPNYAINQLQHLTDLTMYWNTVYHTPTFINELISRNDNLTNLVLIGLTISVDLSNIAVNCPNIQSIVIHQHVDHYIVARFPITENCFKNLKNIKLQYSSFNEIKFVGTNILPAILSAPSLSYVFFSSIKLPDINAMESIIKKAYDKTVFQNLIKISLPNCTSVEMVHIKHIILAAPKLKEINFTPTSGEIEINSQIFTQIQTIALALGVVLLN